MYNDLHLQADWVGQSDLDYFDSEEEEREKAFLYDEYIEKLIDEARDEAALRELEGDNNG